MAYDFLSDGIEASDQMLQQMFASQKNYAWVEKIGNALYGKYLLSEQNELPKDADTIMFEKAKTKARNRARLSAEIIVSGMNMKKLIQEISQFLPDLKELLKSLE
jgi:hypothetical protein